MSKFLYKAGTTLWGAFFGLAILVLFLGWLNQFEIKREVWVSFASWLGGLGLACFILGWIISIWENDGKTK